MHFFDRKFSLAILFVALPLLFFPKFNLIQVDAAETAGLRLDDLILFFVGILLMWAHAHSHQQVYKIEGRILLITAFGLFSFLVNKLLFELGILHVEAKIFYSLRLLEYFIFFYIGTLATQYFQVHTLIRAFLIWNLFLMILQKFNVVGGIISVGYHADVSARVQGIASFPSEMGLLLNLLFCYFIFDETRKISFSSFFSSSLITTFLDKFYLYVMFSIFGIFTIFTGNRISILALCICFIFRLKQNLNWQSIGSYFSIFIPFVVIAMMIMQTIGVYQRSINLFSWKNVELLPIVWDKIDIKTHPMSHEIKEVQNYDMSWWLRIHKWLFIIKSYIEAPTVYLQGLGPGYAGAALDGGMLRIITEYGLIGAFLFWKFFISLYRLNKQTKWMIIAFLINMIFFDAYLAYKTMSVLLFICGHIFQKSHALNFRRYPLIS